MFTIRYSLFFYFINLATSIEQKIDGMCLKEGLSDEEMESCGVQTVGEKRLLKRKIAKLVGIINLSAISCIKSALE